ncbi:MAG: iron complex transport system substrate-binding protein [Candidatus Binatia bacterium]
MCALGFAEQLVGRSHECDFPASIQNLPVCTSARVDSNTSSQAIDNEVKSLLGSSLSIYDIDEGRLRELRPDIVLTQAQCEVCAVSVAEVEAALSNWTEGNPRVVSVAPRRLSEVWDSMLEIAAALDAEAEGRALVKRLKLRTVDIIEKTCMAKRRPSVACIEWIEPLMAAGNWIPDLVDLAGGESLFGESGQHSPWLNWEAVREHDPEIIIVMPCGFDIARTLREMPALAGNPDWEKLRAVKSGRVYVVDGNSYFNRPGPRLVESLEILAEIIYPALFKARHADTGWEQLKG